METIMNKDDIIEIGLISEETKGGRVGAPELVGTSLTTS